MSQSQGILVIWILIASNKLTAIHLCIVYFVSIKLGHACSENSRNFTLLIDSPIILQLIENDMIIFFTAKGEKIKEEDGYDSDEEGDLLNGVKTEEPSASSVPKEGIEVTISLPEKARYNWYRL